MKFNNKYDNIIIWLLNLALLAWKQRSSSPAAVEWGSTETSISLCKDKTCLWNSFVNIAHNWCTAQTRMYLPRTYREKISRGTLRTKASPPTVAGSPACSTFQAVDWIAHMELLAVSSQWLFKSNLPLNSQAWVPFLCRRDILRYTTFMSFLFGDRMDEDIRFLTVNCFFKRRQYIRSWCFPLVC